jgi:hypothetical protein
MLEILDSYIYMNGPESLYLTCLCDSEAREEDFLKDILDLESAKRASPLLCLQSLMHVILIGLSGLASLGIP